MSMVESTNVQALSWVNGGLRILDQRQLPEIISFDDCKTAPAVAEAIRTMRVRGAPAIGIAAAFAVVLSLKQHFQQGTESWQDKVEKDMQLLAQSRPTAVNLFWVGGYLLVCLPGILLSLLIDYPFVFIDHVVVVLF